MNERIAVIAGTFYEGTALTGEAVTVRAGQRGAVSWQDKPRRMTGFAGLYTPVSGVYHGPVRGDATAAAVALIEAWDLDGAVGVGPPPLPKLEGDES